MGGVPFYFTIDTGASQTILSSKVYEKIPVDLRPSLQPSSHNITCAGGTILKEHGKATLDFKLGNLCLSKELIVADIGDEGLLGADIMQEDEQGPGDLMISRGILRLRNTDIEVLRVGKDCRVRKVTAADHFTIPGYCEQVIDVYIERFPEDDHVGNNDILIEPCDGFTDRYPLVMASTVVNMDSSPTQQVRLLNPGSDPVSIYQDSVIGRAERYEDLHMLVESEDPSQSGNNSAVRRLQLMSEDVERDVPIVTACTSKSKLPSHLEQLCSQACEGRSSDEVKIITDLLLKHENAFSRDEFDLGRVSPKYGTHSIDTGTAKPVRCPPRRVPLAFADEERKVIDTMEKQGIIRKSYSCWSSPLCLVRKKDGKVRPCIDYRAVNKVTKMDNFPIPRTRDCLDAVAGAKLFSTFDVTSSYHQIPVKEEDIPKTAFITKYGLYEHCTMPMGMRNSSATFQRCVQSILHGLNWVSCLVYLDDIIVFANTFQEHADRVDLVLNRLEEAGLKLKASKCHLFAEQAHFLGHIISAEGVLPSPDNVARILQFAAPENPTQARALVGMGSYYRRHIKGYSDMMRPIIELTKKGKEFRWTTQCDEALQKLKEALVSPPIMAYPLDSGEYFLDCDASDYCIGGVLSQIQDGEEKVIAYGSKMLNKAERNYCVTDKELLSIRYFVEYFRQYLLGRKFTVRTDHRALSFLFSFKEPKGRLARYLEILSAYDFTVSYRKDSGHSNADGVSRCVSLWDCECNEVDTMEPLKCWPCKKCEKRAIYMKSSLLMGREEKKKEVHYQPMNEGESIKGVNQVTCVTNSVAPNNNRSNSELRRKLNFASGTPCDDSHVDVESRVELSTMLQKQNSEVCGDSNGLVSLRSGISTVEEGMKQPNGECTMMTSEQTTGKVRADETRSKGIQDGGQTRRNSESPTILPIKVILSDFTEVELSKRQKEDPDIRFVYENMLKGSKRPESSEAVTKSPAARHYWLIWDSLKMSNGVIYKECFSKKGDSKYFQLLVPRSLKKEVLQEVHDGVMGGHFGCRKTYEKVKLKYYWYELKNDVNNWVLSCDICASDKAPYKRPKAPLGSLGVGAAMVTLSTDVIGPFPMTPRNNRYILVVTESFTKWVEIFAIPDQTAATTANIILNEVIARYGSPLSIHSDLGSNYESQIFKELCKLMEVRKTRTSVRNPKGNGQVEKFNRTLVRMIKAYLKGQQENWDLNLGCLAAAFRATPSASSKFTPNMLMLGREVRIPGEICSAFDDTQRSIRSYGEYVDWLRDHMQAAHDIAREHLGEAAVRHKYSYDVKIKHNRFEKGESVWYRHERRVPGISPKLQPAYVLCVVLKRLSDLNYFIELESGSRCVVHHDKLKKYEGENRPKWMDRAIRVYNRDNGN